MASAIPIISAVAGPLLGSLLGGNKAAAPVAAPTPPPIAGAAEPAKEPEAALDEESVRLRALRRRKQQGERRSTALSEDGNVTTKTLLGE